MSLNIVMRYCELIVEYGFVQPEVTKSSAFKTWFGNSKVRRRDGSPAVVFHGTGSDVASFRGMVWATHNQRLANDYAEFRSTMGGNPNVMPVFMRIEHPLNAEGLPNTVTVNSFFDAVFKQAVNPAAVDKAKTLLPIIQAGRREEESGPDYSRHDFWFDTSAMFGKRGSEAIFAIYKMLGFDGIRDWENSSDTWGAFSPLQVKSVFNSTFDVASSHLSEATIQNLAQYNQSTGDMEITFDPRAITLDDFKRMIAQMREMRPHTLDWMVNGKTFDSFDAAYREILALMRPRIEAYQQRQEEKRTAWMRRYPELTHIVDMVPTRWLARLRGNDLRSDVSELMTKIDQEGILWPVIIAVGQKDRRARIAEGNHRIEAALRLDLENMPAMVHVLINGRGAQQHSYDVSDDLLIPSDGYVPAEMKPSKVFRSLQKNG